MENYKSKIVTLCRKNKRTLENQGFRSGDGGIRTLVPG